MYDWSRMSERGDEEDNYFCEYDTETILGEEETTVELSVEVNRLVENDNERENELVYVGQREPEEQPPEEQPEEQPEEEEEPEEEPEAEDIIYRLRRMLTEKDDEDYKFHEQNFKKFCNEIIDIALLKTANDKPDRLNEADYLSICTNLKRAFDSHKSMIDFLIRINNELRDDLNWYRKLLCDSEELNKKISKEIADIKRDLNLDTPTAIVSYYDELD